MKVEGAPTEYPIHHIVQELGQDEDFDKFVATLCDEIAKASEARKETLEPVWEDCERNYWANGGPDNPRESDLDFTITFETCKQSSSNVSNPVFAQDTVFMAKAKPGFPTLGSTHDIMLDWIADMSDYITLVNDMIRHAQIYTKATVKSPWIRRERTIRYWEEGEEGGMVEQAVAEGVETRARIEDEQTIATSNFQAGRVSAIANRFRARAGQTSPHSPKTNEEIVH